MHLTHYLRHGRLPASCLHMTLALAGRPSPYLRAHGSLRAWAVPLLLLLLLLSLCCIVMAHGTLGRAFWWHHVLSEALDAAVYES
ncbi:hypothetical protein V8C44DRAFT_327892 [Trichoderma aethiopicum]